MNFETTKWFRIGCLKTRQRETNRTIEHLKWSIHKQIKDSNVAKNNERIVVFVLRPLWNFRKSSQLKWKCLFECLFVSMQIFVASAFILLIGDCLNYANSVAAKILASGDRLFAVCFEMKMSWNLHNLIWFFLWIVDV